jgi:hypothetical protein
VNRPRVIALLSWYDEPASWLAALVASLHGVADAVVAVDGAYALLQRPAAARSGVDQAQTIYATCWALGLDCLVYSPTDPWIGNECEKRSAAFAIANTLAEPGVDWILVVDADDLVTSRPARLSDELATSTCDVGTVTFWHRHSDEPPTSARRLFRADPTLRVEGAHWVYVVGPAGRPRYLWGHEALHELEPADDFPALEIEHRRDWRDPARRSLQLNYYRDRDRDGVEGLAR